MASLDDLNHHCYNIPMSYRNHPKLTAKQQKFCEEYVRLRHIQDAYVAAGYAPNTARDHAHKLFKKEHVQAYIKELLDSLQKRNAVTIDSVVDAFRRIAVQCEEEGNFKDALRAYENLAKYLGMYTERVQIDARHTVNETRDEVDAQIKRLLHLNPDLQETKGNA